MHTTDTTPPQGIVGQPTDKYDMKRRGDWMQTYTGRQFWPLDPRPDEIFIEDIAHALSRACRFAGHCIEFYSVAEHSVLMADWLLRNGYSVSDARWALLHDASEAYLVDVPRPIKPFLTGYEAMEGRVMGAVRERFKLHEPMPDIVKEIDNRILVDERRQNMRACTADWKLPFEPLRVQLALWEPAEAEIAFLSMARFVGVQF